MKKYGQFLKGLPSRNVVVAYADFQPITKDHEKLLAVLSKVAQSKNAEPLVLVTSKKKIDAVSFLQKLFPKIQFGEASSQSIKELKQKYKEVTIVTSAEKEKDAARYGANIVKAIAQDPDTCTESKQMLNAANKGDLDTFRRLAPSLMIELEIKRMFNSIRQSMGYDTIKEDVKFDIDETREKYFNGEIFKVDSIVESVETQEVYKVVKRGSNHVLVQNTEGALISKWLKDVVESTQEFTIKESTGMKFNSADKLKVAKIIASSLGVEDVDKSSNAELLINTALRKIKNKPMKPEYVQVLQNMLSTAKEAGIAYDEKLVPSKVEESCGCDSESVKQKKIGHTLHPKEDENSTRIMKIKHHLGEEKEEEEDLSDEEIEKMISGMSDDDYLEAYDDDELHLVDQDTGEHITSLKEELINEVLSRQERIKAKIRFARSEAKRERKVQIALRTRSNSATINKRARRLAINLMKQRLARRPLDKLSVGEKERIERIIEKRKQAISRIAMRLAARVRKVENDRLSHRSFTK